MTNNLLDAASTGEDPLANTSENAPNTSQPKLGGKDHTGHSMRGMNARAKGRQRTLGNVATIISVVALGVSVTTGVVGYFFGRENSSSDAIKSQYSMFLEQTKLPVDEPLITHLFAMPINYDATKNLVALATSDLKDSDRAKMLLKERSIATYVFTQFEYALYQQQEAAKPFGDKEKSAFSQEVLDYFTGRLLRNPRLLYYWGPDGANLAEYAEAGTRRYYQDHVLHDPKRPLSEKPDRTGPFGNPIIEAVRAKTTR